MDHAAPLDLDLSALAVDDFEIADEELTLESLTGGYASNKACHYCACPCICVPR
jgi:hypothetical protein